MYKDPLFDRLSLGILIDDISLHSCEDPNYSFRERFSFLSEIKSLSKTQNYYESIQSQLEKDFIFKANQTPLFSEEDLYRFRSEIGLNINYNYIPSQGQADLLIEKKNALNSHTARKQIADIEDYLQSKSFLKTYLNHAQNTVLNNYFKRHDMMEEQDWDGALDQENHNFAKFKERVIKLFKQIDPEARSIEGLTLLLPHNYQLPLEKELEGFTSLMAKAGEVISDAINSWGASLVKAGGDTIGERKEKPLSIHMTLREFLESRGFTIKFHSLDDQEISFLINEESNYRIPFPLINEIRLHYSKKSDNKLPISLYYVWSGLDLSDPLKNFIPLRNLITKKD